MQKITGIITAVEEGRFLLATEEGRVLPFMLAHTAAVEPQDLPGLYRSGRRVRVSYRGGDGLICGVAERFEIEDR